MSTDYEESEEGTSLACISQDYSPKTMSNLGLPNPVCMHPGMLSAKRRNTVFCYWGSELTSTTTYCLSGHSCILEDKPAVHL